MQRERRRVLWGLVCLASCRDSPASILCQWNSHGYDVTKVFGAKFTLISPVWLQLKRHGRELFEVTGLHDVDQGSHLFVSRPSGGVSVSLCVRGCLVTARGRPAPPSSWRAVHHVQEGRLGVLFSFSEAESGAKGRREASVSAASGSARAVLVAPCR